MGDVLGAIFGTSSRESQTTTPDRIQQALNFERYRQLVEFINTQGGIYQFGGPGPSDVYTPTATTTDITSIARNLLLNPNYNIDRVASSMMPFADYRTSFQPVSNEYYSSLNRLDRQTAAAEAANAAEYARLRGDIRAPIDAALNRSYYDTGYGVTAAGQAYTANLNQIQQDYNAAVARGDFDLARTLASNYATAQAALDRTGATFADSINRSEMNLGRNISLTEQDLARSLTGLEAMRSRALGTGQDAIGRYIDLIARPRITNELALAGLEQGGAVGDAVAKATAEQAVPYLQSIEQIYGPAVAQAFSQAMTQRGTAGINTQNIQAQLGGQRTALDAETLAQLAQLNAAASGQAAAGNVQLGGELMSLTGAAGNQYQNNINQLALAMMENNVTLEQAGIAANSALGQQLLQAQTALRQSRQQTAAGLTSTYLPLQTGFVQSLPGASQALSLLPGQVQAAQAASLAALTPIADFPRQLKEADFLRRQGLFTTLYTGIPYTPGSTSVGGTATGNIFDQLGGTIMSGLKGGGNLG